MKSKSNLCPLNALALVLTIGVMPPSPVAAQQANGENLMDISEAINAGWVSAKFTGMGGSEAFSIRVVISKRPNAPQGNLVLKVASGSMLQPLSKRVQRMTLKSLQGQETPDGKCVPTATISLADNKPKSYFLRAFFAEFGKETPDSSAQFLLDQPDPAFESLFELCDKKQVDHPTLQALVWMNSHSDSDINFEKMHAKFSISEQEWKAAIQIENEFCKPPSENTVRVFESPPYRPIVPPPAGWRHVTEQEKTIYHFPVLIEQYQKFIAGNTALMTLDQKKFAYLSASPLILSEPDYPKPSLQKLTDDLNFLVHKMTTDDAAKGFRLQIVQPVHPLDNKRMLGVRSDLSGMLGEKKATLIMVTSFDPANEEALLHIIAISTVASEKKNVERMIDLLTLAR